MEYKGYQAKIEFDDEDNAFHGYMIGISDVVHFQATTVKGLEREFKASIDDYLHFCAERGENPDKPYSGKLMFRTTPDTHRKLANAADMRGISINQLLEEAALTASGIPHGNRIPG